MSTLSSSSATYKERYPADLSCKYSLHTRKLSIAIVWGAIFTITSVQVELFYFVLRYGAHTKLYVALTVPTPILLVLSILSIGYRTWQLVRKGSNCRPVGGTWYNVRGPLFIYVLSTITSNLTHLSAL